MKLVVLTALVLAFSASACLADQPRPASGTGGQPKAQVAIGRDGQDTRHRCSTENPNIEYRDCVNASTRDPNAKVRMG